MLFVWKLLAQRSHVLIPGLCSLHVIHPRAIGPVFRFGNFQHISHIYYDGWGLPTLNVVPVHAVKNCFLLGNFQHRAHISSFLDSSCSFSSCCQNLFLVWKLLAQKSHFFIPGPPQNSACSSSQCFQKYSLVREFSAHNSQRTLSMLLVSTVSPFMSSNDSSISTGEHFSFYP